MIFWELFTAFAKVGLLGFGGGLAIVRLIYDSVQPFMDMSHQTFANIVAIAQVTPGPVSLNTATYVGFVAAGIPGAAVASIGVILPTFVLVSIVAHALERFKNSIIVEGAIRGIRPITIGLIASSLSTLLAPSLAGEGRLGAGLADMLGVPKTNAFLEFLMNSPVDIIAVIIFITTIVVMYKFKKSPFAVLIVMGCIGALLGV